MDSKMMNKKLNNAFKRVAAYVKRSFWIMLMTRAVELILIAVLAVWFMGPSNVSLWYSKVPKEVWGGVAGAIVASGISIVYEHKRNNREKNLRRYNVLVVLERVLEQNKILLDLHKNLLSNSAQSTQEGYVWHIQLPHLNDGEITQIDNVVNLDLKNKLMNLFAHFTCYNTDCEILAVEYQKNIDVCMGPAILSNIRPQEGLVRGLREVNERKDKKVANFIKNLDNLMSGLLDAENDLRKELSMWGHRFGL